MTSPVRYFDVLQLFQGLQIFPMNGRSRLEPALRSGLARKARCVEEDRARHDAIFQDVDISLWATAGGHDVFHRPAVVALAFRHHVAVHRIQMAVNDAMVGARILVSIGGAGRVSHPRECAPG